MLERLKVSMTGTTYGTKKIASEDILNFIDRISDMQSTEYDTQYEDIDRSNLIRTYKKALKETSKFAAGEMYYGTDNNIQIEMTRVSEMKAKQEAEKDEEKEL